MLPETVAALAAKTRVSVATLFKFEFASQTMRFWDGIGNLIAGGETWQGAGKLIGVSGLEQPVKMSAPQATFTLTGATEDMVAFAAAAEDEVTGRPCSVFIQFLNGPYQTLDDPIAIWAGNMDVLTFRAGTKERVISLSAETLFIERTRAPFGYYTDTDQQARWAGDVGLEFMPILMNKTVTWLRG